MLVFDVVGSIPLNRARRGFLKNDPLLSRLAPMSRYRSPQSRQQRCGSRQQRFILILIWSPICHGARQGSTGYHVCPVQQFSEKSNSVDPVPQKARLKFVQDKKIFSNYMFVLQFYQVLHKNKYLEFFYQRSQFIHTFGALKSQILKSCPEGRNSNFSLNFCLPNAISEWFGAKLQHTRKYKIFPTLYNYIN